MGHKRPSRFFMKRQDDKKFWVIFLLKALQIRFFSDIFAIE